MIVSFFGHRDAWRNIGVEEKVREIVEKLIKEGATEFFIANNGDFDEICRKTVFEMRNKYHNIKIIGIQTYYHHDAVLSTSYDEIICPPIEEYYWKQKITKRNQWMIENSDIVICHVVEKFRSGAYTALKYAKKLNKNIIQI